MEHLELSRESLGNNTWFIEIELIPQNEFETEAIHHVGLASSSSEERDTVENSLRVALRGMSLLNLVRQKKNVFALTAKS